ncbi:hypothetical protein [Clostridium sp. CT7]|nr:hypothetical protein [Clostridium sp. CT7]
MKNGNVLLFNSFTTALGVVESEMIDTYNNCYNLDEDKISNR